jgi:hypothetical protein
VATAAEVVVATVVEIAAVAAVDITEIFNFNLYYFRKILQRKLEDFFLFEPQRMELVEVALRVFFGSLELGIGNWEFDVQTNQLINQSTKFLIPLPALWR